MAEAVREDRHGVVDVVEGAAGRPGENRKNDSTWEIEEVEPDGPDDQPAGPPPPAGGVPQGASADAEDVYVAVGKGGSSTAALSWALRRLTKPRSFVYLVHVFSVVTSIPTP